MRPVRTTRMIPVLIVVCFLTLPAPAQYSGGTGEPNDPYQIATAGDLDALGETPDDYDKHFILTADIDLDPNLPGRKVFDRAVIAPDIYPDESQWFPRFDGTSFTGVFDGNGHTISNLTIAGQSYLGVFGHSGSEARIFNLGLEEVDVNGSGHCVGGLVGWNWGASITHCYSTGTVNGDTGIGGLVGGNDEGSITHCYSTGTVNGYWSVGGLVGYNAGSITSITHCYSTGRVSGDHRVGGLVGDNFLGSITLSVWDIQTSGLSGSAGGVGLTTAEMMDPYMLGLNGFADDPNWVLDAGHDYPRLAWEGSPGQDMTEPEIDSLQGSGTAEAAYRIDTSDQLILLGKAGILWDRHFVLGADIDMDPNLPGGQLFTQAVIPRFTGVFDGNDHTISHLTIEGGSYLGLFGQLGSGAIISDLGMEAVDVNGTGEFVGGLVGGNDEGSVTHCYSNGSVNGGAYIGGLVGLNRYNGDIANCYSTGTVSGDWLVGGLVGENVGSITQCYSTATVSATGERVGGLVGSNWYGRVNNCYSTGTVNGKYRVGGLVGWNRDWGSIANCYSTRAVSGDRYVGGLVGSNENDGKITKSLWDVETSSLANMCGRQADDAAGCDDSFGKTTAEMQNASTFLDAGWDFVGETANGTENIWWIDEGKDYPHLWWESPQEALAEPDEN